MLWGECREDACGWERDCRGFVQKLKGKAVARAGGVVRVGGQLWSSELDVMQRALQQRWVRSNWQVESGYGAGG